MRATSLRGQQRVAAERRRSRRRCRRARTPSTSAPDARTASPRCGVRGATCTRRRPPLRRRQRPAVDLAVRRERQRVQRHERRRHHVVGQAAPQHAPAAPPASHLAGRRHHVGDEPPVARPRSSRATTAACAHRRVRAPAPPRSRPARCGSRGSSPVVDAAEELQRRRRPASAPDRRCGTAARPASAERVGTNRSAVSPGRPR